MTTKLIITTFFILLIQSSFAQDVQIKKGIILRDRQPVAKMEGKATALKGTDIHIKSLLDEPLINIKVSFVTFKSIFAPPLYYTTLTFIPTNTVVQRLDMHRFVSEKKIVELLYEKVGSDFLTASGLNHEKVSAFAGANNEALTLQKDSTFLNSFVGLSRERLMSTSTKRNLQAPVSFRDFSVEGELLWNGYEKEVITGFPSIRIRSIHQDDHMLGLIITILQKGYSSPNYTGASYYVLKKVELFTVGDQSFEYVPLARLETSASLMMTTMKVEDMGLNIEVPKVNDFTKAESVFVSTLLRDGYLK